MFTIGEFSKFCCISARMLRHYDRIGLLHPAATDEQNGYRYYDSSQIPTFQRIEKRKRAGGQSDGDAHLHGTGYLPF